LHVDWLPLPSMRILSFWAFRTALMANCTALV
jgi:hypothetical protein